MNEKPIADIPESKNELILAKIRVTMGFSEATLDWFREIENTKETSVELADTDKPLKEKVPNHLTTKIKLDATNKLTFIGAMSTGEKNELIMLLPENESYCGAIGALFEKFQIWFAKDGGNLFFSKYGSTFKEILFSSTEIIIREEFPKLGLTKDELKHVKVKVNESHPGSLVIEAVILFIGKITLEIILEKLISKGIDYLIDLIKNKLKNAFLDKASEKAKELLISEAGKYNIPVPPAELLIYANFDLDTSPLSYLFQADISELLQLAFVGLMGANKEIEKILKNFHDKNDKPSHGFLFYEFLVHQPLHKKPALNDNDYYKIWAFYPFLNLLARRSLMIKPAKKSTDSSEKFLAVEDIAQPDILIRMDDSIYTQLIYNFFKKVEKQEETEPLNDCKIRFIPLNEPFIDPQEFSEAFFAKIENYTIKNMKAIYDKKIGQQINSFSKKAFEELKRLRWPIESLNENQNITAFLIPIASSQVFYGDLFVCVPHFKKNDENDNIKLKQLASDLIKCVKKHYVPALAIVHEHFFENLVIKIKQKIIKTDLFESYALTYNGNKIGEYESPICRSRKKVEHCYQCEYFGWEESSDNVVEKYLHKLWQDRRTRFTDTDKEIDKEIRNSFFFADKLYTDPHMLDVLEGFLKPSKAKLKNLPSILVVASPGAGKNDIPTLLKLFTDYYDKGKTYKLNMASLKPDAIVPMAMVGGEITSENDAKYSILNLPFHKEETYKLEGILQKIRKETQKDFEKFIESEFDDKKTKYLQYFNNRSLEINKKKSTIEKQIENKQLEKQKKETQLKELRTKNFSITDSVELEEEFKHEIEEKFKSETIEENIRKLEIEQRKLDIEIDAKQRETQKLIKEDTELNKRCETLRNVKKENLKTSDIKNLKPKEKLLVKELFGRFPTIVLDELNSMSIGSQGVLLRFLENAEITPIGGCEDKMVVNGEDDKVYREFITDFFVVGIMNEDPEAITREEAIRFLQKEKYIGGLLGDLLYEHILKIRRLRPDLRARMMRNGIFRMPTLAEHRADIPFYFYNFIDKDKGDYFGDNKIRITMDALELLMSPGLEWPENVRLLQTLTKKVLEILYEEYDKEKDLIIVREKHIKKAMEEIGMIKEIEKEK